MLRSGLLVALVASIAATLVVLGPIGWSLALAGILFWFVSPGILLARRLYRGAPGSWIAMWLVGPCWGYLLSSLTLLALWSIGIRSLGWLLLAPIAAFVAVWPLRALAAHLRSPSFSRADLAPLLFLLLAVPAIL